MLLASRPREPSVLTMGSTLIPRVRRVFRSANKFITFTELVYKSRIHFSIREHTSGHTSHARTPWGRARVRLTCGFMESFIPRWLRRLRDGSLAGLLLLGTVPVLADFDEAVRAAHRGEYGWAESEFRRLADADDARGQNGGFGSRPGRVTTPPRPISDCSTRTAGGYPGTTSRRISGTAAPPIRAMWKPKPASR